MARLCVLALAALAAPFALACDGTPNNHPVEMSAPSLISTTTNGLKFQIGKMSPPLTVVHVYGTSYEMGVAYGALLKDEITDLYTQFYEYVDQQLDPYLSFLPPALRTELEDATVEFALNLTYHMTHPFIPQHFLDLASGIANSTGYTEMDIMRVALFPELTKMSCSMFGAWGPATANTTSKLVQLRALDWSTNGPFQEHPLVTVFHPSAGNGNTYSTMGWAGLIGAITGYSSTDIAISEKVWLHYKGKSTMAGIPATFLLEEILRNDMDIDQAKSRIASANRTCSIFIGVGDKYNNVFNAIEYSMQTVNFFNDRNFPTYANHDQFEGLVFVDKHTQPSNDPCLNSLMHQYYGSISPQNTLQYITAQFQTGDMHIAIYDFENSMMYVSNASPYNANGTYSLAYDNQFIGLNMTNQFNMAAPAPGLLVKTDDDDYATLTSKK